MFYRIRRILRTLFLLITGCSEECSTIWQVTGSLLSQKSKLQNWIASKDESFFRDGIRKLPERWEKVGSDGQYFNWSVHLFCFQINAFLNTKKRTELIYICIYICIYIYINSTPIVNKSHFLGKTNFLINFLTNAWEVYYIPLLTITWYTDLLLQVLLSIIPQHAFSSC